MKVSVNWLKDFVDAPADPNDLKLLLTNLGLGVESVSQFDGDSILQMEITTNRPDCLSHYGVAREIAAACRVPLKGIEITLQEYGPPIAEALSIQIDEPSLCARYCGRIIRNCQVKPSPAWLVSRLASVGAGSINNVADVTNYLLLALGHPLHAFDLARVRQHKIIVRRARIGETLKTLDGVERKLAPENLVIADQERALALAGVMGGEDSGITNATTSVLVESAWFDPLSIRRTAKAQGMHTEASHRFERGADIGMAPVALDHAAALIRELAGGEILRGRLDVYPQPEPREAVTLRRSEIFRILGAELPWEDVERGLRALGFAVERRSTEAWRIIPPTFRLDVTCEVDLIEEAARLFGYDRLPARLAPAPPRLARDFLREKELELDGTLVSLGYLEIKTSPMIDPAENAVFSERQSAVIENPLSQEASALRTSALPTMLAALRRNLDYGQEDLRLFETGKVYWRSSAGYEERRVLALGLAGHRRPATVHDSAAELSFFDVKGDLETVLELFEIERLNFRVKEQAREDSVCRKRELFGFPGERYTAVGLVGEFRSGETVIAILGQLDENLRNQYKLRRRVWLAELNLDRVLEFPLRPKSFRPFSRFPAVERDLSLLVPDRVKYGHIEKALLEVSAPEVLRFNPVDLFRGSSIEPGFYTLLLRFTLQSPEHTLTGEEISVTIQKILEALAQLGIRLRGPSEPG